MMAKIGAIVFLVAIAGASAGQSSLVQPKHKALYNLKEMLETIRKDVVSMKPTIRTVAGLVDTYVDTKIVDTVETVEQAYQSLNEKNLPTKCLDEATKKLNEIRDTVVPECSAVHIAEDAGTISFNTINLVATSMMYFDEVLNGFDQCYPWYKFWHFIPCSMRYVATTYTDLSGIITKGWETFNANKVKANDIVHQLRCKATKLAASPITTNQVLEEAYLCAKNIQ